MLITLALWPPCRRSNRTGSRTAPKPFLSDSQWLLIADLLADPPPSPLGGRPRVAPRLCLEGIIWVLVSGDEVSGYRINHNPGDTFQREFSDVGTTATFLTTTSFAVFFLLLFFVVSLFLKKYHEGEVGTKTALMVFIGLFAVSIISTTRAGFDALA